MSSSAYVLDETPAARRELAVSEYGAHQNAEDLIRTHFASIPPEVRSGLRLGENADALARAKEYDVQDDIEVPEGCRLIDWTVRGQDPRRMVVSYVYEDERGTWHHGVQGYGNEYQTPDLSPADQALREVAMAEHRTRRAGAELHADQAEAMEAFRKEQEEKFAEKFASLKEELVATIQQIAGVSPEKKSTSTQTEKPKGKSASSTGESGKGDASEAPEPKTGDADDQGKAEGEVNGEAEPQVEVKWPHVHDDMDALAKSAGLKKADLPADWGDLNLADKQAFLESKNVQPEAQS